jgi:alpha-L-fucosidase 2
MFDAHPPFQIDGNFGGTRAIAEMLMQSRGDEILLLPALPRAWPTGSVNGLQARGTCQVDLAWRDGALANVTLTAALDGERVVRLGDARAKVRLRAGRAAHLSTKDFLST